MTESERPANGVSRRTMLKRIGAAGAIAWTTPVISSLTTPAHAAASFVTCGHTCDHCATNRDLCGQAGVLDQCFCTPRAEGGETDCFCGEVVFCDDTLNCTSNTDCAGLEPGNWICSLVCGCSGQVCIPPCGSTERVARTGAHHGATSAGTTI